MRKPFTPAELAAIGERQRRRQDEESLAAEAVRRARLSTTPDDGETFLIRARANPMTTADVVRAHESRLRREWQAQSDLPYPAPRLCGEDHFQHYTLAAWVCVLGTILGAGGLIWWFLDGLAKGRW